MEKSLKQIIYETNVLADAHIQLRSFYYGDLLDIIKIGAIDYASCFLSINSASNNANFETFNLELFVFDILASDDSNRTDIENTTKRILNDLITTIRYSNRWNDFSEVLNDVSELKYYDKLQDRLSGWGCTIQLKVYRNDCLVGLPIDGYDFDMGGNFEATVLAIVKNTDNDILATKLVSDSDDTIIVPNITVTDSDGSTYSQASGVNVICTPGGGEANYELDNTLGTLLSSGSIPAGDTEIIIAPDGTVRNNADINSLSPVYVVSVPSGSTVILPQITVTDSDGSTYLQDSVTNVMCTPSADATVTVNGEEFGTVASGGNFELDVVNTTGADIGQLSLGQWVIDDAVAELNGVQFTEPSGFLITVQILNQVGSQIGSKVGSDWVVINPIRGNFQANRGVLDTFVVDDSSAGVYTGTTNDGGSGTVTITVNGVAIAFPQTLVIGDLIDVSRSTTTSIGWYQLNG
jgi:hypothetical protein